MVPFGGVGGGLPMMGSILLRALKNEGWIAVIGKQERLEGGK